MSKRRRQTDIITGIDIGSTAIRVAVAQVDPSGGMPLQIIGAVEGASEGVQRGLVTSIDETVS